MSEIARNPLHASSWARASIAWRISAARRKRDPRALEPRALEPIALTDPKSGQPPSIYSF
jgi:hypothetical protein